jgi:hypothetical protein
LSEREELAGFVCCVEEGLGDGGDC